MIRVAEDLGLGAIVSDARNEDDAQEMVAEHVMIGVSAETQSKEQSITTGATDTG